MIEYPWMAIARRKLGIHEIPGPEANAFIVECLKSTTLGRPDNQSDETAWCSAFANRVMQLAGYEAPIAPGPDRGSIGAGSRPMQSSAPGWWWSLPVAPIPAMSGSWRIGR